MYKRFFSSPEYPDWLWGPPNLLLNGNWGGSFPRDEVAGALRMGRNEWSQPPLTLCALMVYIRTTLLLSFYVGLDIHAVGNYAV